MLEIIIIVQKIDHRLIFGCSIQLLNSFKLKNNLTGRCLRYEGIIKDSHSFVALYESFSASFPSTAFDVFQKRLLSEVSSFQSCIFWIPWKDILFYYPQTQFWQMCFLRVSLNSCLLFYLSSFLNIVSSRLQCSRVLSGVSTFPE